jgi:ParB family transcriptional regulator, chromosome partitioning protein
MTMQSVSLSALEASAANPRRKIDRKAIEGLAASIRTDGLLHNLVVSPVKGQKGTKAGKKERYQIVSGSRRFEALRLLEQRGELPEDFTVAVEVRDDLSKDQTLRIATVENLQRQNMTPLEEAAALTKLVHKGVTLDDVVAQTGHHHQAASGAQRAVQGGKDVAGEGWTHPLAGRSADLGQ